MFCNNKIKKKLHNSKKLLRNFVNSIKSLTPQPNKLDVKDISAVHLTLISRFFKNYFC